MLGFRHGKPDPATGSRYGKVGSWETVWTVEKLFQPPGLAPHVRLVDEGTGRHMTLAVAVVTDLAHFTPMDKP
ncbi:hypothetical protein CU669_20080 [Paramagnetospirillum kuznetsovii]|uniref:Uncharacterized protein n=1 Tax=Paramagnetospirillum kuznetsovii TaxID=2053833 RepID=A0A364NSS1_9PROT|nr:hypothetical protein [Paramagnetospirillum kuznetsovii]RAU20114.1 hypothetical protein CU669_20080 [Paramagnetospirillum kuznetsovii]